MYFKARGMKYTLSKLSLCSNLFLNVPNFTNVVEHISDPFLNSVYRIFLDIKRNKINIGTSITEVVHL